MRMLLCMYAYLSNKIVNSFIYSVLEKLRHVIYLNSYKSNEKIIGRQTNTVYTLKVNLLALCYGEHATDNSGGDFRTCRS